MHTHGQAAVDGAGGMLEHRGLFGADARRKVRIFCACRNGHAFQEGHLFIQQRHVTCGLQVIHAGMRQPQQVVRKMGAHTHPKGLVPPVLHIAVNKLARRIRDDLRAQHLRCGPGQRHHVLQLVPEPGGPACLVKTGFGPQAA